MLQSIILIGSNCLPILQKSIEDFNFKFHMPLVSEHLDVAVLRNLSPEACKCQGLQYSPLYTRLVPSDPDTVPTRPDSPTCGLLFSGRVGLKPSDWSSQRALPLSSYRVQQG